MSKLLRQQVQHAKFPQCSRSILELLSLENVLPQPGTVLIRDSRHSYKMVNDLPFYWVLRRPYDSIGGAGSGASTARQQLARRVFVVLMRM